MSACQLSDDWIDLLSYLTLFPFMRWFLCLAERLLEPINWNCFLRNKAMISKIKKRFHGGPLKVLGERAGNWNMIPISSEKHQKHCWWCMGGSDFNCTKRDSAVVIVQKQVFKLENNVRLNNWIPLEWKLHLLAWIMTKTWIIMTARLTQQQTSKDHFNVA